MTPPLYNPAVPFVHPLQGALLPGQMVRVQGEVFSAPNCFAINLQTGPRVNPRDDIALHISPVFTPPPRVVRNSLQMQRWGPEESHGGFPLSVGAKFEILILVERDEYKIAINGSHFTQFRHRIPLNMVSFIAVDGDVTIHSLSFEGQGAPMSSAPMPSAPMPTAPMPPTATGAPLPYPTSQIGMPPYPPAVSQPGFAPGGPAPYPAGTAAYPTATPVYPSSGAPGYAPPVGVPGAYPSTSFIPGASAAYGSYPHRKSSPIPIGGAAAGIAAGVGAAALGAAMLGHHPMKKMKKLYKFKHKFKKPKFFKHKFGKFHKGWKHKGWSSGSSSSEEE